MMVQPSPTNEWGYPQPRSGEGACPHDRAAARSASSPGEALPPYIVAELTVLDSGPRPSLFEFVGQFQQPRFPPDFC
jgi:hypothetical protein